MPQDVTFDLPFGTPVNRHLEYAHERRPRCVRDTGLVRGRASVRRVQVMESAADRPHLPARLGRNSRGGA